jgi:hypothetical protein
MDEFSMVELSAGLTSKTHDSLGFFDLWQKPIADLDNFRNQISRFKSRMQKISQFKSLENFNKIKRV